MKTRILKTEIYSDPNFYNMSQEASWLCIYLLTNQYIGLTGAYTLRKAQIVIDTRLSPEQLNDAINEVNSSGIVIREGEYFIISEKYRSDYKNGKSESAFLEEYSRLPNNVKTILNSSIDSTIDGTIYSTPKSKTLNNKSKTIKQKIEKGGVGEKDKKYIQELNTLVEIHNQVHGTTLRTFTPKLEEYTRYRMSYELDDFVYMIVKRKFLPDEFSWITANTMFNTKSRSGNSLDMISAVKDANMIDGSSSEFVTLLGQMRLLLKSKLKDSTSA